MDYVGLDHRLTLTWTPTKAATEGRTITYVVGAYDSKTKTFKEIPVPITDAESAVTDISSLGFGRIGVQEVLTDTVTGKVLAKSAIRVVTVRA